MSGFGGTIDGVQNTHQLHAVLSGGDAVRAVQDTIDVMIDLIVEQAVKAEGCGSIQLNVGQIAVDVVVHLQIGIQLGASFGAEQLDGAFILFDIQAEAGFHRKQDVYKRQSRGGVRVAAISLPCRYLHSPACVLQEEDCRATAKLLKLLADGLCCGADGPR